MLNDETPGPPFAVVRTMPLSGFPRRMMLPFLFLETASGDVVLHHEALIYARASLGAYELATIERDVQTIGRLYDFYRIFWHTASLSDCDIDYIVYLFLVWRHSGTLTAEGVSTLGGLRWKPLASDGLRAEFSALVKYFRFCSHTWGHIAFHGMRHAVQSNSSILDRMRKTAALKERDFFVHLKASRDFWANKFGNQIEIPAVSRSPSHTHGQLRHVMSEEEVWQIIRHEKNPVYRALWLVGAFGGIRISEQLNAWQCDVLPSSLRKLLFHYDGGSSPLFLRADPVNSRYLGDLGRMTSTREQSLASTYALQPRCSLASNDPLYAGWKGTLYLQRDLLLSEVFWLNQNATVMFAECAKEIREFHRIHESSKRHPYFYVNMFSRSGQHLGAPIKISNVEAAWDRACRRCGLEPHRWGRNIHGLRHFYKLLARDMAFTADDIQIMLGHRSVESQDSYGRTARSISTRLQGFVLQTQSGSD